MMGGFGRHPHSAACRTSDASFHWCMPRYSRFVPFVAALMVFFSGCGKRDSLAELEQTGIAHRGAAEGQMRTIGNGSEPQDLDPQAVTGVTEHKIISALFEGLAAEDPKDLHPVPGLAEKWDISE